LRPTLGGLTKDQMRIYEEFGKLTKMQVPTDGKGGETTGKKVIFEFLYLKN
jgi:hypothetical protein